MIFTRFENLLKQAIGLDATSIGVSAVERAVQARIRACRLKGTEDYWEHVIGSGAELQQLIEAVVVPETWFFRDAEAFTALARMAVKEWLPHRADGVLRLLSLPCSTGEEPYTMAMALLDAGLPAELFTIDAIDISGRALEHAQRGVYGRNSFRGRDLAFRDRHFVRAEQHYRISDIVRSPVRFSRGNLFDAGFLAAVGSYDAIFCRNLLIYFDPDMQKRAIGVLDRLLDAKGMLFVGHSETSLLLGHGFASTKIAMAFAFRKQAAVSRRPKPAVTPARPQFRPFAVAAPKPAQPVRKARVIAAEPSPPAPKPSIDELRQFADRGFLAEAAKGCEAYLRESGPAPEALHLLGLISDAAGELSVAAKYYRKTLYLEPDHEEALGHLALLLKRQGDTAGARILDDRLRRLDQRRSR